MVNDVTNWLSQTTDNSKYFVWSPGLWDKESSLYIFLAHLSRRLIGELIGKVGIRRPSVIRRRPYPFNIISSETTGPIKGKIIWSVCGMGLRKDLFADDLKLRLLYQVLENYQVFQMVTVGWSCPILRQGKIWSHMLLYEKKLKQ